MYFLVTTIPMGLQIMATNHLANGLKRSALTVALGLCFVGGVQAQTNTAGAVSGSAASGDTITVSNPATGFSRTITVDSSGSYRFAQLPTGTYQVSRNGGAPRSVNVNVGTSSNVDFVNSAGDAQTLDTVTVIGTGAVNPIDVSSVESTTILTAEQVAKIPVPRNITSVALLAPGTVRGATAAGFGSLPSFGGSSVAENQFYVNGFNITNTFKNLAFALGLPNANDHQLVPIELPHPRFARVSAGEKAAAGLTPDGRLFTWGSNEWGQSGLGPGPARYHPSVRRRH